MAAKISGVDAHFLLFAVDAYVTTNRDGRVTEARNGLSLEGWQRIRNRLFEMHEHQAEDLITSQSGCAAGRGRGGE